MLVTVVDAGALLLEAQAYADPQGVNAIVPLPAIPAVTAWDILAHTTWDLICYLILMIGGDAHFGAMNPFLTVYHVDVATQKPVVHFVCSWFRLSYLLAEMKYSNAEIVDMHKVMVHYGISGDRSYFRSKYLECYAPVWDRTHPSVVDQYYSIPLTKDLQQAVKKNVLPKLGTFPKICVGTPRERFNPDDSRRNFDFGQFRTLQLEPMIETPMRAMWGMPFHKDRLACPSFMYAFQMMAHMQCEPEPKREPSCRLYNRWSTKKDRVCFVQ